MFIAMKNFSTALRFLFIVSMLVTAGSLPAQSIRFSFNNGGNDAVFPLNTVRKITFSGTLLNLHLTSGTTESWEINTIRNYSFDEVTGLKPVSASSTLLDVQVFPNPSPGTITISYTLQKAGDVSVEIYDLQGKLVRQMFHKRQAAGKQSHIWNASDEKGRSVAPGNYICKIVAEGEAVTQRILLQ